MTEIKETSEENPTSIIIEFQALKIINTHQRQDLDNQRATFTNEEKTQKAKLIW